MLKPDIRSLQANDSRMWDFAFYWLWPKAYSAAKRRLEGPFSQDVEDVAVLAIKEAADQVAKGGQFRNFDELIALTVVIADRRAKDHIRRMQAERRAAGATETIEGREDLAGTTQGPLEQANAHDVARLLNGLVDKLREPAPQLLKAYYLKGLKQEELAQRFGIPIGTVGVTLSRALKVRRAKKIGQTSAPFYYCGPVIFESWRGEKPITIDWRLNTPVPERLRKLFLIG